MTERCPAKLVYGTQPHAYRDGEPLAELPTFTCQRPPHDPESVHMCDGVVWVAKT